MQIIRTAAAMQRRAKLWQRANVRVALVPTMGYLHDGHLSLVREARKRVGARGQVVVSIYVNPTQFAPTEDLSRYPRDLKRDLQLCRAAGVNTIFTPDNAQMYPAPTPNSHLPSPTFSTYVVE
ncbi:MAG: hypothetical protein RL380_1284, partial [Verrucomicrobiota bacterium]